MAACRVPRGHRTPSTNTVVTAGAKVMGILFTASKIVPAAAAELNVGKEKNGNVQIDLKAGHLAKPSRLTPPASSYVVWLQQEGSEAQSQGELKIGDDQKGELKTATPLRTFNVFVTAEADSQTKFPSQQVVLQATVQE